VNYKNRTVIAKEENKKKNIDQVHLIGTQDQYNFRKDWSFFTRWTIGFLVAFQTLIITLVGLGRMSFTDYPWLITGILVQNFGNIVALAYIIVKAIFEPIDQTQDSGTPNPNPNPNPNPKRQNRIITYKNKKNPTSWNTKLISLLPTNSTWWRGKDKK